MNTDLAIQPTETWTPAPADPPPEAYKGVKGWGNRNFEYPEGWAAHSALRVRAYNSMSREPDQEILLARTQRGELVAISPNYLGILSCCKMRLDDQGGWVITGFDQYTVNGTELELLLREGKVAIGKTYYIILVTHQRYIDRFRRQGCLCRRLEWCSHRD